MEYPHRSSGPKSSPATGNQVNNAEDFYDNLDIPSPTYTEEFSVSKPVEQHVFIKSPPSSTLNVAIKTSSPDRCLSSVQTFLTTYPQKSDSIATNCIHKCPDKFLSYGKYDNLEAVTDKGASCERDAQFLASMALMPGFKTSDNRSSTSESSRRVSDSLVDDGYLAEDSPTQSESTSWGRAWDFVKMDNGVKMDAIGSSTVSGNPSSGSPQRKTSQSLRIAEGVEVQSKGELSKLNERGFSTGQFAGAALAEGGEASLRLRGSSKLQRGDFQNRPRPYHHSNSATSDEVFTSNQPASPGTSAGIETGTKLNANAHLTQDSKKHSLMIILSGLYGLLLVVLGLVLPIAETFTDPKESQMVELYYVYLYAASLLFLIYVYAYLLRRQEMSIIGFTRSISRKFSRVNIWKQPLSRETSVRLSTTTSTTSGNENSSSRPTNSSVCATTAATTITARIKSSASASSERPLLRKLTSRPSTASMARYLRRKKIAYDAESSRHTGGFYLRVGVICFGIGSMIHSGLTFGHYFEINHSHAACRDMLQAIKPFSKLVFTFVQMYFVFMNSKMCVHKYKSLARFGLMHMSGTNICVWLRSIVVETLHVMTLDDRKRNASGSLPELTCQNWDAMMGKLVQKSSVYLYPCTIEYSLVCACVLYTMWSNVGLGGVSGAGTATFVKTRFRGESTSEMSVDDTEEDDYNDMEDDDDDLGNTHRMSVDCAGSSRGLFSGIFLFVVAVVSLVFFYVLIGTEKHETTGTILGHISENFIYLVTFIATILAAVNMRSMHFSPLIHVGIEEILTIISLSGLILFGMFSIVISVFFLNTFDGVMTILTNILMILQASTQATFTLMAVRASAADSSQVKEKPGRQFVSFLLISNFALWVLNTFETQRLEHNRLQAEFFGPTAWSIFSHISVPLGIYFRFHSTVALSNVWKKAWKMKHMKNVQSITQTAL